MSFRPTDGLVVRASGIKWNKLAYLIWRCVGGWVYGSCCCVELVSSFMQDVGIQWRCSECRRMRRRGGAVELLLVYSCHFHLLHHCHYYTLSHPQPTRIIVHTFAILCVSVGRSPLVGLGLGSPESQLRRKQDAELLKKEI